jgi:hypothetical protein
MKRIKRWIDDYSGELVGFGCFLIFIVLPFGLLLMFTDHKTSDAVWMAEREQRAQEFRREHPSSGSQVETVEGLRGTVTRECWLGLNRYEVRLKDGSITYINGKDFIQKRR